MNNDKIIDIFSNSVEETLSLGQILGRNLIGGELIALIGPLGTGKTHLIKGIAQGLGIPDPEAVTSPTFTLINEYEGSLILYHIDAYRLDNEHQLEMLGFDEMCAGFSAVVVEWADKVPNMIEPYDPITIRLEHRGENQRHLSLQNLPAKLQAKLSESFSDRYSSKQEPAS